MSNSIHKSTVTDTIVLVDQSSLNWLVQNPQPGRDPRFGGNLNSLILADYVPYPVVIGCQQSTFL